MTGPSRGQEIALACQRIGFFLLSWSFVERRMNEAIKQIFRLANQEGEILISNIQFRDKVNIIRSSINLHSTFKDKAWRKAADDIMIEILDMSTDYRNIIVHNPFFPKHDGTIVFYRSIAKKRLDFPTLEISPRKLNELLTGCRRLESEIQRILTDLQSQPMEGLVGALLGMPTIGRPPPDYANLLTRLPQASPNSSSDRASDQNISQARENHQKDQH